ncbi:hypothetical protein MWU75_11640 [Ornithinimicrobium sp. F0845]|uniref:hypothetical protein n=1 Tax=Ornithinimicrobium sp. F0845 TaxID=2926412 RepID=UPI001FF1B930|nr:hypothetical protein [Ornithinimicrobium sp. F0845]
MTWRTTVSDLLLHELERFMSRPSKKEVLDRIAAREPALTSETSAEAIARGRDER